MSIFPKILKRRWLLVSAGILLLIGLLTLAVGSRLLYANPLFQTWIKSQICEQSKGAFAFRDIGGGFVSADLSELSLDLKGTPYNVRKVQAPQMKASFAWIPLLQNRLVIRSLVMEGGRLDIRMSGGSAVQTALPVSASFKLKKGTVNVANFCGWDLEMEECNLSATQSGSEEAPVISGTVSAARAKLGGLVLENVESRFRLEKGRFQVENLRAVLPGKSKLELSGSYALDGKPVLTIEMAVNSPDIRTLLQAVDFSDRFSGRAQVSLKAKGLFTPSTRSLEGNGEAKVSRIDPDIELPHFPAFNDAPIFTRVRDIDDLEGKAIFQLTQSKILVTELDLKNADVQITGSLKIGYDRSLASTLLFQGNKTVAGEIPQVARGAFQYDKDGNVLIPFQLVPNTHNPQVDVGDVVNKVFSNQLKGLNPLNLFK